MNRGSGGLVASPRMKVPGFNEAPIHESGKSHNSISTPLRTIVLQ